MEKKEAKLLLLIAIIAFVARLVWILHCDNTVDIWNDWWDMLATNLVNGRGYIVPDPIIPWQAGYYYSWRPPAFPFFLAGVYSLFGHSFFVAKIFMAMIGSFSVLLIYFIGKRIFNQTVGFLAALGVSLYPTFIFFTGFIAPDTLTLFLVTLFIFSLTRDIEKPSNWNYVLAGISLGLATLCRTITVAFFPIILLWMLFVRKKGIILKFALLVFFMLITISPWVVRNYFVHHKFVLLSTDGGQAMYINNNPTSLSVPEGFTAPSKEDLKEFGGLSEYEVNNLFYKKAMTFIKSNPRYFMRSVWQRFLNFWRLYPHRISGPGQPYSIKHVIVSFLYTAPVFIFAIIGFILSLKNWRESLLLYFLIIYYSGMHIIVRGTIRYRMPIEPFIIIVASYGIYECWRRYWRKQKSPQ